LEILLVMSKSEFFLANGNEFFEKWILECLKGLNGQIKIKHMEKVDVFN
jgi:hypothetical protein